MTGALRNARDQLEANREAKHRLEMDWSDKVRLLTVPSIFKLLFFIFSLLRALLQPVFQPLISVLTGFL